MFVVVGVSVLVGGLVLAATTHGSTGDDAWVAAVTAAMPTDDGDEDGALRDVVVEGVEGTLIAWFGAGVLVRYGCHAWGRLTVNAWRALRGRRLRACSQSLALAFGYPRLYADAWSHRLGRAYTVGAGVLVVLALPVDGMVFRRPLLAVVYGLQAAFLLGELLVAAGKLGRLASSGIVTRWIRDRRPDW